MRRSIDAMRFWKCSLAALGSAASLAFFCAPAQADICAEPDEVADDLVEFYADQFEDFFPREQKACEELAKTFLKACNSAVKDAVKCSERQLDAIPKAAKPVCEGTKNPSGCVGMYKDEAEADKEDVADEADTGFADCENNAGLLGVFCVTGPGA